MVKASEVLEGVGTGLGAASLVADATGIGLPEGLGLGAVAGASAGLGKLIGFFGGSLSSAHEKKLRAIHRKVKETKNMSEADKKFIHQLTSKTKTRKVGSKLDVYLGMANHTKGGLTHNDLMINNRGQIVSKKKSQIAKKRQADGTLRSF